MAMASLGGALCDETKEEGEEEILRNIIHNKKGRKKVRTRRDSLIVAQLH